MNGYSVKGEGDDWSHFNLYLINAHQIYSNVQCRLYRNLIKLYLMETCYDSEVPTISSEMNVYLHF